MDDLILKPQPWEIASLSQRLLASCSPVSTFHILLSRCPWYLVGHTTWNKDFISQPPMQCDVAMWLNPGQFEVNRSDVWVSRKILKRHLICAHGHLFFPAGWNAQSHLNQEAIPRRPTGRGTKVLNSTGQCTSPERHLHERKKLLSYLCHCYLGTSFYLQLNLTLIHP